MCDFVILNFFWRFIILVDCGFIKKILRIKWFYLIFRIVFYILWFNYWLLNKVKKNFFVIENMEVNLYNDNYLMRLRRFRRKFGKEK